MTACMIATSKTAIDVNAFCRRPCADLAVIGANLCDMKTAITKLTGQSITMFKSKFKYFWCTHRAPSPTLEKNPRSRVAWVDANDDDDDDDDDCWHSAASYAD